MFSQQLGKSFFPNKKTLWTLKTVFTRMLTPDFMRNQIKVLFFHIKTKAVNVYDASR